ncbi:MAG: hypothetical protein A2Y10_00160 [Planctomycetes bacterium GWF2_41_51]|nr:MAG: hypothetical protein A2Y10_00160 [Planctomycetes bacterium GWF2_41_51]HBG27093.1 hypothetical protein [Phycisphaerales bacterium]
MRKITNNILVVLTFLSVVFIPPIMLLYIVSGLVIGFRKGFRPKSLSFQLLIFSSVFLVLSVLFFIFVAIPVAQQHEESEKLYSASYNLRIVRQALINYVKSNNDILPSSERWCDELLAYDENLSKANFKHPADPNWVIAMNRNVARKNFGKLPNEVVLLLEAKGDWNTAIDQNNITRDTDRRFINIILKDGTIQDYWLPERGIKKGMFHERYVPVIWMND